MKYPLFIFLFTASLIYPSNESSGRDTHTLLPLDFAQRPLLGNDWDQHFDSQTNDFLEDINQRLPKGDPEVWNNSLFQHVPSHRQDFLMDYYLYQTWVGTEWVNDRLWSNTYDANNNLTSELGQNWDGTQWVIYRQVTYTYDANNNRTSYLYQDWDGTEWVNDRLWSNTYDANNNQTSYLHQDWDGTQWVNNTQYTYTYDANNNRTSNSYQNWDGTQWVNYYQQTYTYDANNNQTSYLYQDWDGTQWVNNSQRNYTYDANNNAISYLYQSWDDSVWVNNRLYTNTYDANNNMILMLRQHWDETQWVNYRQYIRTYDANNNQTSYLHQDWDGTEWVNYYQQTYTYDANNNQTSYLYQDWDGTEWVNDYQRTYTYDANNNLTSRIYQDWDGTQWVNNTQYTYTYDANNNQTSYLYQDWDGTQWVNNTQTIYVYLSEMAVINNIPDQEMLEEQTLTVLLSASNTIGGTMNTFSASSDTSAVSVDVTADTLHIVPAANWGGTALITVTVDSDNGTSDTTSFNLTVHKTDPLITYIEDVPEDQGGWVYVGFLPSYHDSDTISSRSEMYSVERFDDDQWVNVASGVAYDEDEYVVLCPTTKDSTSLQNGITTYRVIASMDEGIYLSLPDSGYSVDNIAPGVPEGLLLETTDEGLMLSWDASIDEDFQYYRGDKSADSLFQTDQYGSFNTADPYYLDTEYQTGIVYYRVSAVDHAGNEGEYSEVISTSILGTDEEDLIPTEFALRQNFPNPFNPTTTLRYDLPQQSFVSLNIYDLRGRLIRVLVNDVQPAGVQSIIWNGTNTGAEPVSAGMYLYSIEADGFQQTRKMVLLK